MIFNIVGYNYSWRSINRIEGISLDKASLGKSTSMLWVIDLMMKDADFQ
jgi:hypothetical protein